MKIKFGFITTAFLIANAAYGLGFALFSGVNASGVSKSSLYKSLHETSQSLPALWGIITTVAVVLAVVYSKFNYKAVGSLSAALGLGTWLFASLVYLQTGFALTFITVGLLYLSFWVWFYFTYISNLDVNNKLRP
jgi:hypothetical protein